MIDLRKLIQAGVHFGHQKSRWCPKMRPYIWGVKDIHFIDVSKTAYQLEKAAQFLESVAASGKPILWVGTKKAAQDIILSHATQLKQPYVTHRWIGGILTNYSQVKKSITKLLHYEDILAKSSQYMYTKKELNKIEKLLARLKKNVGGIRTLTWPVGAIVIIDVKKEHAALKEAKAAGVPVVALVDTNSDPSGIDYVIPANDDAPRSIALLIDYLAQAVSRGLAVAKQKPEEELPQISPEAIEDEKIRLKLLEEEDIEEDPAGQPAKAKKSITRTKTPRKAPGGRSATAE